MPHRSWQQSYPIERGDYHGLQSYVDTLEEMTQGFIQAEAGYLPDPLPLSAFTTSAIDETLAPPGHHTVYLACPSALARMKGGWEQWREMFVERCLEAVEARAPGFRRAFKGYRHVHHLTWSRWGAGPLGTRCTWM